MEQDVVGLDGDAGMRQAGHPVDLDRRVDRPEERHVRLDPVVHDPDGEVVCLVRIDDDRLAAEGAEIVVMDVQVADGMAHRGVHGPQGDAASRAHELTVPNGRGQQSVGVDAAALQVLEATAFDDEILDVS